MNANPPSSVDIDLLKREVDALQIALHSKSTPWYKTASTLISLLAFTFSFGTTLFSYQRTHKQDIQASRVELRSVLQRLAALPKENIENIKKYESKDPGAMAAIGGFINQENALLSRQAAEITRRLPPEYVSATEYFAISTALGFSYNMDGAKEFAAKAVEASVDLNDRVSALRTLGNLLYLTGQPDAGRVEYQKALNVFSTFTGTAYNDYTVKSTHIWTELSWANSEASIGARGLAMQHVANAERYLSDIPESPGKSQLAGQVNQTRMQFAGLAAKPPAAYNPLGLRPQGSN